MGITVLFTYLPLQLVCLLPKQTRDTVYTEWVNVLCGGPALAVNGLILKENLKVWIFNEKKIEDVIQSPDIQDE